MKPLTKVFSALCAFVLVFGLSPTQAFADPGGDRGIEDIIAPSGEYSSAKDLRVTSTDVPKLDIDATQEKAVGSMQPDVSNDKAIKKRFNTLDEAIDTGAVGEVPEDSQDYVDNQIIVTYNGQSPQSESTSSVEAAVDELSIQDNQTETTEVLTGKGNTNMGLLTIPNDVSIDEAMLAAANDDTVAYVQVNPVLTPDIITNDPMTLGTTDASWQINNINAPQSWDRLTVDGKVTIAVFDDGTRLTHEDLADNTLVNDAWDAGLDTQLTIAVGNNGDDDIKGHGTMVAGMAAARANNGKGLVGTSYNASMLPVKLSGPTGWEIAQAATYVVNNKDRLNIRVVVISYEDGPYAAEQTNPQDIIYSSVLKLNNAGILVVASGGNDQYHTKINPATSQSYYVYPSDYPETLSVTATDYKNDWPDWSDYNEKKDLAAPGANILTTTFDSDSSYALANGTSFSAPSAAGVAALVFAANPNLTPAEAKQILETTAIDLGAQGYDPYFGNGLVNADEAVWETQLQSTTPTTVAFNYNYQGAPAATVENIGQGMIFGTHLPANPARPNYFFTGWNTMANGAGTPFTSTTVVTAATTVYAQWALSNAVVTFDCNYQGAPAATSVLALQGVPLGSSMPAAPTRQGFGFEGWNTLASGMGDAFYDDTVVGGNTTVYAIWSGSSINAEVTFNYNYQGSPSNVSSPVISANVPLSLVFRVSNVPESPTRQGYTFAGWNTRADGTGRTLVGTDMVRAPMALYAKWMDNSAPPQTVTVAFDYNYAGAPPAGTVSTSQGTSLGTAMPADPDRPGYAFTGWSTASNGAGTAFTASTLVNGNITVYAQWEAVTPVVTVAFDLNYPDAPAVAGVTVDKGASIGSSNMPANPKYADFYFVCWNTKADGTGEWLTYNTPIMAPLTAYAQWERPLVVAKVTFDLNYPGNTEFYTGGCYIGESVDQRMPLYYPTRPDYATGGSFMGWNTAPDGSGEIFTPSTPVMGDMTVYAQWSKSVPGATRLTLDYNYVDKPINTYVAAPLNGSFGTKMPPDATRKGYVFTGWNTAADGTGTAFTSSTIVTLNTSTLYAQWAVSAVDITIDLNYPGAPPARVVSSVEPYGKCALLAEVPTRPGYSFKGWVENADGVTVHGYITAQTTFITSKTAYATWQAAPVNATFDYNYPGAPAATVVGTTGWISAYQSASLVRPNYSFAGWNTKADGTGAYLSPSSSTMMQTATTYYAQWAATPANVTLNYNYSGAPAAKVIGVSQNATVGEVALADAVRPGYTLTGWNTTADGTGTAFAATTAVSASVTAYAQWKPAAPSVSFDWNYGDMGDFSLGALTNFALGVGQGASLGIRMPAPNPVRPNYVLVGWNTKADGTGTGFTASTPVMAPIRVYAQWARM